MEDGTVIARSGIEAKQKLRTLNYRQVTLKKLKGFTAFVRQFRADIR